MNIRKRLFLSNILMIVIPVAATLIIAAVCAGLIWFGLLHGVGLGLDDRLEFDITANAVNERVEDGLKNGKDLSSLKSTLKRGNLTLRVEQNGRVVYQYGTESAKQKQLYRDAVKLGSNASVSRDGYSIIVRPVEAHDRQYVMYLSGKYRGDEGHSNLMMILGAACAVILLTIVISVFLTNRFLTKYILKRIEEPLDILTDGVRELSDGNLDYRIHYDRNDEFRNVCDDFNNMAVRLSDSVEAMQRQDQSRKELIAGISHDIRSPLTSIKAYTEGLIENVADTPEMKKSYLDTIRKKADELEHMISQLFMFSKMELGEFPEHPENLELDKVIEDIVSEVRDEYEEKGISVELDLEPVTVYADRDQMQRIVLNILGNSLKYKDSEKGHVNIRLRGTDEGSMLEIADDGPGVPFDALPHLFEVFYRSDPARRHPGGGSGLGLAIVENAVSRAGGRISARANSPHGLIIEIEFPEPGKKLEKKDVRRPFPGSGGAF